MGFFDDLIGGLTGQQSTPQQTIIPTSQLLNQAYGTATNQAGNVQALNAAYQPIITGTQLANENQIYGPAANQVRQGAYQSILNNLNLGNAVPQDLQDLITTNTLQQLGSSGLGASDAGKLFGARSLLSAGLDLGAQRRNEALQATNLLPTSHYQYNPIGIPNVEGIAGMIDQEQAARDNLANIQEQVRQSNFSSLINTGGRILGTVAGGVVGGMMGNPVGGVMAGQAIGGGLFKGGGVAGYGPQQGGGQQSSPFTSLLSGVGNLFNGQGYYSGGAGAQYMGGNGDILTSSKAIPVFG